MVEHFRELTKKVRVRCSLPNQHQNILKKMNNLEKIVTDTILQRASDVIVIDGIEYQITPPTPATLILVSELIAGLPIVNRHTDNIIREVLSSAKDLSVIGKIAATLILGAKRIKESRYIAIEHTSETKCWSWKKFRFIAKRNIITEKTLEVDYLAERILNEVTNKTLVELISNRLGMMQIADFFELTTFLSDANLLKRTREVVATASGD